jgi:hypothetical protein
MSQGPAQPVRLVTTVVALGLPALALCWGVSSVATAGPTALQVHAATQSLPVARQALVAREAQGAAALPVGAASGFPFGYALDEGAKISLLPPNDADVDQARVAAAPKLGPWKINVAGGDKRWPNACDLTGTTQLHELFPAIVGVQGAPVGSKVVSQKLIGPPVTAPNYVRCLWDLKTTFAVAGSSSSVGVYFDQVNAGAPSTYSQGLAQQKTFAKQGHDVPYPWTFADYHSLENGVKCFDDGTEWQCLKDDAFYWIQGQQLTGGPEPNSDDAAWIDQIELPLAEVIGAELSTNPS